MLFFYEIGYARLILPSNASPVAFDPSPNTWVCIKQSGDQRADGDLGADIQEKHKTPKRNRGSFSSASASRQTLPHKNLIPVKVTVRPLAASWYPVI